MPCGADGWCSVSQLALTLSRCARAGHLTLHEQLLELGLVHLPADAVVPGIRRILRDGGEVFRGTAGEVWAWLRETKQIEAAEAAEGRAT